MGPEGAVDETRPGVGPGTPFFEDADAEFLANPRIVTADNQQAKIEVIRNQPVPQLNFNEQTATAVFGGFKDKTFGNTLIVRPSINKDNFITLSVKPEISNKVSDFHFSFNGADVFSPIIDKRSLDSNVLIKSGDTLALGGLISDQASKSRTKVPLLGDGGLNVGGPCVNAGHAALEPAPSRTPPSRTPIGRLVAHEPPYGRVQAGKRKAIAPRSSGSCDRRSSACRYRFRLVVPTSGADCRPLVAGPAEHVCRHCLRRGLHRPGRIGVGTR